MERENQHGIGAGGSIGGYGNSGGGAQEHVEGSMAEDRARLRERRRARLDTVKVKTFTGEGWHLWKFKMQQYLALMDVWRNVSGELPQPSQTAPYEDQMDWLQDDLSARNVLCNTVDDERLQLLTHCHSSAEMWKVLVDKYEVVSIANEMRLDEEFNSLRQGSKSVDAYLKDLNATVDKLRGIGKIVSDRAKMLAFLKGLNREFGVLSVMLENQTGTTFDQATASVLTHEMRYDSSGGGTSDAVGEAYAGGFRGRGRGRGGRNRGRGGRATSGRGSGKTPAFNCYSCGKEGHLSRNCPDAQRNGPTCLTCGKRGHLSYDCPTKPGDSKGEHYSAEGVLGEAHSVCKVSTWIVDSGATHHVCNEEKAFSVLRGNPTVSGVLVGNNAQLDVPKEGEVKLDFAVGRKIIPGTVDKVLFVPEMARNLFSVTQTMKQGKSVLFDSKSMSCKILKDGKQVGAANLEGGLWVLECDQSKAAEANVASKGSSLELWHQRLGHLGEDNLRKLHGKQMVSGLDATLEGNVKGSCEGCKEGRQHREPFQESENIRRKKLELVQSDIKGPITPSCHGGFKYFLTFLDVGSRKCWVYLLKQKNEAFPIFKWWKAQVEREAECKVKAFRTDQGGEFSSKEFQAYLRNCGIRQEFTVARTPQQNGRAERLNRTLMDTARSMTNGADLPKEFWGEAVLTAAYLKNRSPHSALEGNVTPDEVWTGLKPSVSHLRIFGCQVGVHVPKESRRAADSKSWKGTLVGYSPNHKGYKVWSPSLRRVVVSRDVIFHEEPLLERNRAGGVEISLEKDIPGETVVHDPIGDSDEDQGGQTESGVTEEASPPRRKAQQESLEDEVDAQPVELASRRTSGRERNQPERLTAQKLGKLHSAQVLARAYLVLMEEPNNLKEALASPQAASWKQAVQEELKSLEDNKTWEVCPKPQGRSIVGCKWVFKVKSPEKEGGQQRFKARLVAKGYSQQKGIDYHETFAPVIKYQSLRLILSIAAQQDMHVHQMDVKTAFLNGELQEEIYMEMPEGLERKGQEGKALRLRKSLYGLKQSPRCWNQKMDSFMRSQKFVRLNTDSAVYTRGEGRSQVILGLYVDDMLILGPDLEEVRKVKGELSLAFQMVDFGEASKVLGIRIRRNRKEGSLTIDQEEYVQGILERFEMEGCKESAIPLATSLKLTKDMSPTSEEAMERMKEVPYREAIGSLMYLMVSTRPDIAAAVGILSRFLNNPGEEHWMAVKKVFRYLQGTKSMGIVYKRARGVFLSGYTDSDWAGDVDSRKSTSAYVMMLGGGAVSWKSKRQDSIALSSTEAEFMASTQACKEVLWMKDFLGELGLEQGTIRMYSDNQSSIKVMKNPVGHGRMKHIELQAHFLRDLITREEVEFVYCSTELQVADSLTKAVPQEKVELCNQLMGLKELA